MIVRLVLPLALLASACVDTAETDTDPARPVYDGCIVVEPAALDFGGVPVAPDSPGSRTLSLEISNPCLGALGLLDLRVVGEDAERFALDLLSQRIVMPEQMVDVSITVEPRTAGELVAQLEIHSDDPDRELVTIALTGAGVAPRIEVTPEAFDYGAPSIGCEQGLPLRIANVGNADLIVDEIGVFTASYEEFGLDLDVFANGRLPFTIGPYDATRGRPAVDVYLDYLPLDTFRDDVFVSFGSNDPFSPEVVVEATGTGTHFARTTDVFVPPTRSSTDILFTLDRSSSMDDNLDAVIENFDVFVETLSGLDHDYHAAVVVADDGCVLGADPYIDGSFSASEAVDAFRVMVDQQFELAPYGSNTERGFTLAEAALQSRNLGIGGCNSAFYRDDALLSIVHVSDESEQSINSWSYYVALFQSLESEPEDVTINAVAGDYPSGCATASAGTGYYEATVATGGLFLSICAENWAVSLEDLAAGVVRRKDSFELNDQPVPQTLEVAIDGVRVHVGWEYEISSNSVVFDAEHIPPGGSTVDVSYQRMPDCER